MVRLERRRNRDSAFLWLFFSFTLAVFLGAGFSSFFSQDFLQAEFQKAVAQLPPDIEVESKNLELKLADSWLPQIALASSYLKIKKEKSCTSNIELHLHGVRLPIKIISLLQGELQWNPWQIQRARLQYSKLACLQAHKKKPSQSKNPEASVSAQAKTIGPDFNLNFAEQLADLPDKISFDSLEVEILDSRFHPVYFLDLQLEREDSEIRMDSDLSFHSNWTFGKKIPKFKIEGKYKDKLQVEMSSRWLEGRLFLQAFYDFQTQDLYSQIESIDLPIQELVDILQAAGKLDPKYNFESQWIYLKADWNWNVGSKESVLSVSNLKSNGKFGNIIADNFAISLNDQKWQDPLKIQVQDFDLSQTFEAISWKTWRRVLSDFGVLQANFIVDDFENFSVKAVIEDLDFRFSRSGERFTETLVRIPFLVQKKKDMLELSLKDPDLKGGKATGNLKAEMNLQTQKFNVEAAFENLIFSDELQKQFFRGSLKPVTTRLQIEFDHFQIQDGSLNLQLPQLASMEHQIEDLRIQMKYDKEKWAGSANAKALQFNPDLDRLESFHATLLDLPKYKEKVSFRNLKANFIADESSIEWSEANADFLPDVKLRSQGRWSAREFYEIEVWSKLPGFREMHWIASGPFSELEFRPHIKTLRRLAKIAGPELEKKSLRSFEDEKSETEFEVQVLSKAKEVLRARYQK